MVQEYISTSVMFAPPDIQICNGSDCVNMSSFVTREEFQNFNKEYGDFKKNVDVAFVFLAGDIVLFLQCGFAFLEAGVIRSKNVTNILLKNLLDLFFSGIAFWLVGWAFFKGEGNGFIGWTQFACVGVDDRQLANWFFQCVFAATASTIISGAVAERCEFVAYIVYSTVISGFLYPVVAHWAWNDQGWLAAGKDYPENVWVTDNTTNITSQTSSNYHYVDFSGSGVVHVVGGACSFVGAAFLGPRLGRFDSSTGKVNEIHGHSLPLAALGGFILVFGIMSFNGGTQSHLSQPIDGVYVATILVNTLISGSFAAITALFVHKSGVFGTPRQWSLLYSLNGSLVGMVATCAGGNLFYMWAAAIVGVVGGLIFFPLRRLVILCKVDDPLDAVAVHLGGGSWGVIAAVIFAKDSSLIYSDHPERGYWLAWNLAGLLAIILWSVVISCILFGALKALNLLRVPAHVELKGLDVSKHGELGYPLRGWEEDQYTDYLESGFLQNGTNGSLRRNPTGLPHLMHLAHHKHKGTFGFTEESETTVSQRNQMHANPAFVPDSTAHL